MKLRNRSIDDELLLTDDEEPTNLKKYYHDYNDFRNLKTDYWGNKVDTEESETESEDEKKETEERTKVEETDDENKCKVCNKIFVQASNLKRHIENIHVPGRKQKMEDENNRPSKISKITCQKCDKDFANAYNLKRHMKLHEIK